MKTVKLICIAITFVSLLFSVKSDAVCTEQTLLTELQQDIADNGNLDCLRKPLPPPTDKQETEDETKKREEAKWDTDCAFEADYDWVKQLKDNYGLKSGLVDVNGKAVDK